MNTKRSILNLGKTYNDCVIEVTFHIKIFHKITEKCQEGRTWTGKPWIFDIIPTTPPCFVSRMNPFMELKNAIHT